MKATFYFDPNKESAKAFADRVVNVLYPEGAKHCMMHCKFTTGYYDGSGAFCNNLNSPDYLERVRSWDTVEGCPCFEEGKRIVEFEEVSNNVNW